MKNFKKVISAVVALALSATTFVSAASFTDVAKTASYAEAIDVLSSLGIVNGYEDGTFKPEGEITRAEAATMIVGALNMTADAVNAAGTSSFADVNEKAAWASGYINVGVAQGFINGMGDGTFAPQANVTYAQMCVMLTIISGYGEYAANGGYPTGYTNMAATTGINKGVAVADNTALTRGQVAQMIYNTLTVPMLGVSEYNLTGNTYAQLDGKKNDFKSLLSDKFDGYVATIKVTKTPVADGLENDEVKFVIQKADWWYDGLLTAPYPTTEETAYVAEGVDVNNNKLQIGRAVFVANEDDEPVLVYFAPTGKVDTKELDADTYVKQEELSDTNQYGLAAVSPEVNKTSDSHKIRFGSKYYTLENGADIYVNGIQEVTITNVPDKDSTVAVPDLTTAQADLDKYLGNAVGTITLVDDGVATGYEAIFVEIWNVAKVLGVEYENGQTVVSMTTKNALTGAAAYDKIVIDDEEVEEGKTIVSVEKNGEAAELTSLAKGDIIAYKSEIGTSGTTDLTNPKEVEIIAANDTASGKVTSIDTDEETYTIGGTTYSAVVFGSVGETVTMAETYTITLDPFGRIYEVEKDGSSAMLAIALDVTSDEYIKLVLADGTVKSYPIEGGASISGFTTNTTAGIDSYLRNTSLEAYQRVVKYKVRNSSGEISSIQLLTSYKDNAWSAGDEYKSRTSRLGSSEITSATAVIDASKAALDWTSSSGYVKFNPDNFKDRTNYKYVSFNEGTYITLVVIKEVGTKINTESRFAVLRTVGSLTETDDGDLVYAAKVLLDGEEKELLFKNDPVATESLAIGDAFFYELDAYGQVSDVFEIYNAADGTFTTLASALTTAGKGGYISTDATKDDSWTFNLVNETKHDVQLAEGYVVQGGSNQISFAAKASPLASIDTNKDLAWTVDSDSDGVNDSVANNGVAIFAVTEDTEMYLYSKSNTNIIKDYDKFSIKADASTLSSTSLEKYELNGVYTATDMTADANYAIAMIIDEVVVAVYVIK